MLPVQGGCGNEAKDPNEVVLGLWYCNENKLFSDQRNQQALVRILVCDLPDWAKMKVDSSLLADTNHNVVLPNGGGHTP